MKRLWIHSSISSFQYNDFILTYSNVTFSGILVLVNYISICIFFPSVVVTYHYFWQEYKVDCSLSSQPNSDQNEDDAQEPARNRFIKPIGELFKCVVNWFEGPYVDYVILHPIVRWIVLAFFLSTSLVFVSFSVQLRPDEEQVSNLHSIFLYFVNQNMENDFYKDSIFVANFYFTDRILSFSRNAVLLFVQ